VTVGHENRFSQLCSQSELSRRLTYLSNDWEVIAHDAQSIKVDVCLRERVGEHRKVGYEFLDAHRFIIGRLGETNGDLEQEFIVLFFGKYLHRSLAFEIQQIIAEREDYS
jgi:hypothetical protein